MNSQNEGQKQIQAGINLICWSKLARWDEGSRKFVALPEKKFEHFAKSVHPDYGRLICWVAFSVGAEYLAKGVCLAKQQLVGTYKPVYRTPPREGYSSVKQWISDVLEGKKEEEELTFGTLGGKVSKCIDNVTADHPHRDIIRAGYKYLANAIRNRDAHRYTQNVRAFHFHAVEKVFVPAFNALLTLVEEKGLSGF